MKEIFLTIVVMLLLTIGVGAQDRNVSTRSVDNSTTTALDTSGTFTGTWEMMSGFNSLTITNYSNVGSSSNGLQVQFSQDKSNIDFYFLTTYTAADSSFAKTLPVFGMWMRVVYTVAATDSATTLRLVTTLHQNNRANITTSGDWKVYDATVEASLTSIEVDTDSLVSLATTDATKQDSLVTLGTADATKQDSIVTLLTADGTNQDSLVTLATADATKQDSLVTLGTADATRQDSLVTLATADATNQDSLVTLITADATRQDSMVDLATVLNAKDFATETTLALIKTNSDSVASAIVGGRMQTDVFSIALPSGASTSALQDSILAEQKLQSADLENIKDNVVANGDTLTAIHTTTNLAKAILQDVDDNTDGIETKQDSLLAEVALIEALNAATRNYVLALKDSNLAQMDLLEGLSAAIKTAVEGTLTVSGTVTATPSGVQEIEGDEAEGASMPNPILIGGDDGTDIKNINVDASTGDVQVDVTNDVDINDISKGTQTNDIKITLDSEAVILSTSNIWGAANSVEVTTETDSITLGASSFFNFSIYSVNDTIEVSFENSFAQPSRLLPTQSFNAENMDATSFTKAYIRRKGSVGTAIYDYEFTGR